MVPECDDVAVVPSRPEALWLRLLQLYLRDLRAGELTVFLRDGRKHTWTGTEHGPNAALRIRKPAAFLRMARASPEGLDR